METQLQTVSLEELVLDLLQVIFVHKIGLRKGSSGGDFHLEFFLILAVLIAKSESCMMVKVEK